MNTNINKWLISFCAAYNCTKRLGRDESSYRNFIRFYKFPLENDKPNSRARILFLSISRFLSTNLNHLCRLIAFFLLSNSKVVCNVHFLPVKYSLAKSSARAEGLYNVITKIIQTLFTRVREQLEIYEFRFVAQFAICHNLSKYEDNSFFQLTGPLRSKLNYIRSSETVE